MEPSIGAVHKVNDVGAKTRGHVTDVMETTIWLRTAGLPKKSVITAGKWDTSKEPAKWRTWVR